MNGGQPLQGSMIKTVTTSAPEHLAAKPGPVIDSCRQLLRDGGPAMVPRLVTAAAVPGICAGPAAASTLPGPSTPRTASDLAGICTGERSRSWPCANRARVPGTSLAPCPLGFGWLLPCALVKGLAGKYRVLCLQHYAILNVIRLIRADLPGFVTQILFHSILWQAAGGTPECQSLIVRNTYQHFVVPRHPSTEDHKRLCWRTHYYQASGKAGHSEQLGCADDMCLVVMCRAEHLPQRPWAQGCPERCRRRPQPAPGAPMTQSSTPSSPRPPRARSCSRRQSAAAAATPTCRP